MNKSDHSPSKDESFREGFRHSEKNGPTGVTRREFFERTFAATIAASVAGAANIAWGAESAGEVPRRTLGRTGEKVSAIGLGGGHIGHRGLDEQGAIRIVRTALDSGINFLDNCWDYNGGQSEIRMGKALLDGYRRKAFLMTKVDGRDKKTAQQQLDESLRRLQTDHLDLLQFHEIIRMEDPSRVFAPGGALEAVLEAKKAGKVRYIGFTGHKSPEIHLKMLETADRHHFRFDTVQMPLNVMDAHYDSFEKKVVPVLVKKHIGILGMKPMGGSAATGSNIMQSKTVTPVECLQYALSLPTSVVITGCESMEILQQALDTVRNFRPLSSNKVAMLLAKTDQASQNGQYEIYKSSTRFDGTVHNPQWLG